MKTSAILLAGGKSSRMGSDKSLLPWGGVTLLQSTHDKMKDSLAPESRIWVSGQYPGFSCLSDEREGRGPIEGIWSCTRQMELNSAVLVVPVDMPLLDQSHFQILIDQIHSGNGVQFVQFEKFEMPFVFIFNARTDQILREMRESENPSLRSLRQFKSQLLGKTVPVSKRECFKNVNTPIEWKEVNE